MEGTRRVVRRLCHSSHQSQMAKTEDLFGPLSADHRKWRSQRAGDDSVVLASQLQGCGNIWNKCTICWAEGGLLRLCWHCFHLQVEGGYPEKVIYVAPLFGTPFCSGAFLWLMERWLLSGCNGVLLLCLGALLGWGQPLQTVPGVALYFVMQPPLCILHSPIGNRSLIKVLCSRTYRKCAASWKGTAAPCLWCL